MFDFSGLKTYPPPGFTVCAAGAQLVLSRRREHEPVVWFTVTNRQGKFQLWRKSDARFKLINGNRSEGELLMEKDTLMPLLVLLGYARPGQERKAWEWLQKRQNPAKDML